MKLFSFEFLKEELQGSRKARIDSYLYSPLYYLITGRKGAWLYRNNYSSLIICNHPHIQKRLMIFPEIGLADYSLTASVLGMLDFPKNGIQLSRYTNEDLKKLKQSLEILNQYKTYEIKPIEELIMDWRFPIHILDTQKVASLEGKRFGSIRTRYNKAKSSITFASISAKSDLNALRAVLKFWEGNMILKGKDSKDMAEFYLTLFELIKIHPESINGLLFMNDRRPVGFCIWDQPKEDTANSLVNLGDTNISGLSDYQTVVLCQILIARGIQFLNLGGSETVGLNDFKVKFRPAFSIDVLSAEIKLKKTGNNPIERFEIVPE